MTKEKKRQVKQVAGVIIGIMLVVLGFLTFMMTKTRKNNGVTQLSFAVGETLSGYDVTAYDGERIDIGNITKKDSLVVFGMDKCRDCIADMPLYKQLYENYNSDELEIVFVWDNAVPVEELENLGIPKEKSFSAMGQYKFTDWVPSYYLIDESNVIFDTTDDISEAYVLASAYPMNPISDD